MRTAKTSLLILALALPAGLSTAPPARAQEPAYVSLSAGAFNLRSASRPELGGEVRFSAHRFAWLPRFIPALSPVTGGFVNSKGGFYVYAGLRCDIPLRAAPWELSIQFAPGVYSAGSGGFKLGGPVEFRSGIEVSRQLGDRDRVGLMLFHISNAHIYVHNPGSESLMVTYHRRLRGDRP
jgi:lipid A 3-O-deacylase